MRILHQLLDFIYPPRCASCGTTGEWWCVACREAVESVPQDPCAKCLSVDPSHDATACAGPLPFAGVAATGFYHSRPLRRVIAALKYDGVTAAMAAMDVYLRDIIRSRPAPLPWADAEDLLVVPMPLSSTRERERGFNQASWLAERLPGEATIALSDLLIRRTGAPQAELEHDAALRAANVKGQFTSVRPITQPVLLVDDVVTTGSTAAEAAQALLRAGAPRVYLFALAVGK